MSLRLIGNLMLSGDRLGVRLLQATQCARTARRLALYVLIGQYLTVGSHHKRHTAQTSRLGNNTALWLSYIVTLITHTGGFAALLTVPAVVRSASGRLKKVVWGRRAARWRGCLCLLTFFIFFLFILDMFICVYFIFQCLQV